MKKAKIVVSHLPPHHLDDFLAVAFYLTKVNPKAEVQFIHPQADELLEMRRDPSVTLIDVGGDYNPKLNNFDHHQNSTLPCSLVLLTKDVMLVGFESIPFVQFIDTMDRQGFRTASEQFGVQPSRELDDKRKEILLVDVSKPENAEAVTTLFFTAVAKNLSYDRFLNFLHEGLDDRGLLDEPRRILEEQERQYLKKLNKTHVYGVSGLKVMYSTESLAPYHSRVFTDHQVDVIIERNSMNPSHTSVIKNTRSSRTAGLDLSRLFSEYPKVFLHATGFLAVLDAEVSEVEPEKVITVLLASSSSNGTLPDGLDIRPS